MANRHQIVVCHPQCASLACWEGVCNQFSMFSSVLRLVVCSFAAASFNDVWAIFVQSMVWSFSVLAGYVGTVPLAVSPLPCLFFRFASGLNKFLIDFGGGCVQLCCSHLSQSVANRWPEQGLLPLLCLTGGQQLLVRLIFDCSVSLLFKFLLVLKFADCSLLQTAVAMYGQSWPNW